MGRDQLTILTHKNYTMNISKATMLILVIIQMTVSYAQSERVLVISGGGSRGAWGGGVAKQLILDTTRNYNYRCIFGTSSGSLLAPLIALEQLKPREQQTFHDMERGFTDVSQKSIFSKDPFNKRGKIKGFSTFLKILFGVKNLGETHNLKDRIEDFFSREDFALLKDRSRQKDLKTVVVSTVNLTRNQLRYRSSDTLDYDDMVNWVWASANQPVFMTPVPMQGDLWVDGGVKENVPVEAAVNYAREHGIDSVDVIILNTLAEHTEEWGTPPAKSGILPKILRTIGIFSDEIKVGDIKAGIAEANTGSDTIVVQVFFMDEEEYQLAPNSNLFQRDRQRQLWDRGFTHKFSQDKSIPKPRELPINNVIINYYR